MALEAVITTVSQTNDGKKIYIKDTTGLQSASNPHGWGGSNLDPEVVSIAVIRITVPTLTDPIDLRLYPTALAVTLDGYDFTKFIDQDEAYNIELNSFILGITEAEEDYVALPDGTYNLEYLINNNGDLTGSVDVGDLTAITSLSAPLLDTTDLIILITSAQSGTDLDTVPIYTIASSTNTTITTVEDIQDITGTMSVAINQMIAYTSTIYSISSLTNCINNKISNITVGIGGCDSTVIDDTVVLLCLQYAFQIKMDNGDVEEAEELLEVLTQLCGCTSSCSTSGGCNCNG